MPYSMLKKKLYNYFKSLWFQFGTLMFGATPSAVPAGLVLDLPLPLRTPPNTVSRITCKEATGARNPRILCTLNLYVLRLRVDMLLDATYATLEPP